MNEENWIAVNILGRGVMSCCYTVGTLGSTAFRTKSNNTLWLRLVVNAWCQTRWNVWVMAVGLGFSDFDVLFQWLKKARISCNDAKSVKHFESTKKYYSCRNCCPFPHASTDRHTGWVGNDLPQSILPRFPQVVTFHIHFHRSGAWLMAPFVKVLW